MLALLLLPLSSGADAPDSLSDKRPYLLLKEDQLLVRVNNGALVGPRLEWQVKGVTRSLDMVPVHGGLWEGRIRGGLFVKRYQILAGVNSTGWIDVNRMKSTAETVRFVAYGDNRSGYNDGKVHESILAQLGSEHSNFIINTGDLVYRGNNKQHWESYFKEGRGVFERTLQFPTMGNHDRSRDNRFNQLFPLGAEASNYYAFRSGPATFIVLDSTESYRPGSKQYAFLKNQLETWHSKGPIIVTLHHPPYSTGKHGSTREVIRRLVPLFEDYGVALVLSGHDHNYQRIGPINGVLYIVTGGGGGPLYKVAPHPVVKNAQRLFHYVLLEVKRGQLRGWMKDKHGDIQDEFELSLDHEPVPVPQREKSPKLPNSRFRFFD